MDYSKFNDLIDMTEVSKLIEESENGGEFERLDVPFGDYEVKIVKLELGENTFEGADYGKPQLNIWFKIINHPVYNNQMLFCTKKLWRTNPQYNYLAIKDALAFLETLESQIPVTKGENWQEFGECVEAIFNDIDGRAEYQLHYEEVETKGGYKFKNYVIVQRY